MPIAGSLFQDKDEVQVWASYLHQHLFHYHNPIFIIVRDRKRETLTFSRSTLSNLFSFYGSEQTQLLMCCDVAAKWRCNCCDQGRMRCGRMHTHQSCMHLSLKLRASQNALLGFISSGFIYSAAGGEKKNGGIWWVGGQLVWGLLRMAIRNVKRTNHWLRLNLQSKAGYRWIFFPLFEIQQHVGKHK